MIQTHYLHGKNEFRACKRLRRSRRAISDDALRHFRPRRIANFCQEPGTTRAPGGSRI
jgi:hypothetical protein